MTTPPKLFARAGAVLATLALIVSLTPPAARATGPGAAFPFPPQSGPYAYSDLHITNGSCAPPFDASGHPAGSDLPASFDCRGSGDSWMLTDYAPQPGDSDYDPTVENNPQELYGVKGGGMNRAWEKTTGRPDTVIAITDSGIEWYKPELRDKVWINQGELPVPCVGDAMTVGGDAQRCPMDESAWVYSSDRANYDVNGDEIFNVEDYANDPRVADLNHNGFIDVQDLIHTFSDGIDHDHDGYVNDITGWDFYQFDNDPGDDVTYGHGSGEAGDSSADIGMSLTVCPNCMFMPIRVGDSFIAEINAFAQGVIFAVDHGVSVVQEALGTLNHTAFAQAAVDYAYAHGVLVDASEADEEAGHHNYPAALNHTMVVNSATHFGSAGDLGAPGPIGSTVSQTPKTYLAFNGCTNFGGYTWVSVESSSCSSEATGKSSGTAGLIYSEARNMLDAGGLLDASGQPRMLSAEEVKQIIRASADDIDFSTPKPPYGPPNNFATTLPDSMRYVTTKGWDQITGWGRLNAHRAVDLVAAGEIPPVADITSPSWWEPLGTAGHVVIRGSVDAPRDANGYTYAVQFAPGVQPPRWPASEHWTTIAAGSGDAPKTLDVRLDLARVHRAILLAPPAYTPADDPTSRDLPEKDAFRVRIVVHGNSDNAPPGIEQRQYFSYDDPTVARGWPKFLNADGASSPAFADLNGDGQNELVIGDGNGFVHAFEPDGSELHGWPVQTDAIPLPDSGTNAYTRHQVSSDVHSPLLLGSPTVADLDGDGKPEVAVAAFDGKMYVWHADGSPDFSAHVDPDYSHVPGCQTGVSPCDEFVSDPVRDHINVVNGAFTSMPAAGKLSANQQGLDLVVGAEDGHVYAWDDQGNPVPGWPVLLRDPSKVAAVDPVTHRITFKPGAAAKYGRQVVAGVSIGALADGTPVVAANVDEEYDESPNWSLRDPVVKALAQAGTLKGNTRTYLLYGDGTHHAGTETVPNLGDNAYVPGWPVKIGMVKEELLPDVGSGSDGAPVFGDVNGTPVVATASIGTPPYLLKLDGSSYYGNGPDGGYLTMASGQNEFKNPNATDGPSVASLGGGVFGRLGGPSSPLSFAMGSTGLKRLLDVILPDQQLGAEDHVGAWDAATGTYEPGFPAMMNDLMFFNTPAIADVSGDGLGDVLQSSAMYDLRAYSLGGAVPLGFPKFTGGWSVMTPAIGEFSRRGTVDVALATREGNLFVWHTPGKASQATEWPKYQHDLHNSGNYATDATPPGPIVGFRAARDGSSIDLSWIEPGDNGMYGRAAKNLVTVDGRAITAPAVALPGTRMHMSIAGAGVHRIVVQAVDDAGNKGFPVAVSFGGARGHADIVPLGLASAVRSVPLGSHGSTGWTGLFVLVIALGGFAAYRIRRALH